MKNYEYHRIGELATQLGKAGIKQETIDKIMEGGENILRKTNPAKKAGDKGWLDVEGEVDLAGFAPGIYELRVTVKEKASNKTAQRAAVFSVE